ncbi:MFS transporter [bacterium]|nr:MFS transporter [bacterium]
MKKDGRNMPNEEVLIGKQKAPSEGKRNVFLFGMISLFTDISSEMIYSLVPGFLRSLGATSTLIGLIEGIAEATAALSKSFFGWLSDRLKNRKLFVFLGYSLSALSKPFLFLAGHWSAVLGVRFADRTGKGLRSPARDALLSQSVSAKRRGLGFGFQRAMDNLGAASGPLLAMLILYLSHNNMRLVFLLSVIPALIGVSFIFFVREIRSLSRTVKEARKDGPLDARFIWFSIAMVVFTLGNSSNAFLLLRAQDSGISLSLVPLIWTVYSAVAALSSPVFGHLSDKIGRRWVILVSFVVYSAVYFLFGNFSTPLAMWLLFAAYGVHHGLSEGVFRAFIADLIPAERRATAYGIYETMIGLALFPASLIFGLLWDKLSPQIAFYTGAGLSLLAGVIFIVTQRGRRGVDD